MSAIVISREKQVSGRGKCPTFDCGPLHARQADPAPTTVARTAVVTPECLETRWYAIRYANCTIGASSCLETPIHAYFSRAFSYFPFCEISTTVHMLSMNILPVRTFILALANYQE